MGVPHDLGRHAGVFDCDMVPELDAEVSRNVRQGPPADTVPGWPGAPGYHGAVEPCRLLDIPEPQRPDAEWREVMSLLARQGLAVEDWPLLTHESADDLSGLLSLVGQPSAADIARRATATAIPGDGGAAWAEGAHALLGRFEWLAVRASGAAEGIRAALAHFARLEGWAALAGRLRIEPSARASLDELVAARVAEAPGEAWRALMVLRAIEPSIEWEPFIEAAVHRLREYAPSQGRPPQTTANDSRWLLHSLRATGRRGPALER